MSLIPVFCSGYKVTFLALNSSLKLWLKGLFLWWGTYRNGSIVAWDQNREQTKAHIRTCCWISYLYDILTHIQVLLFHSSFCQFDRNTRLVVDRLVLRKAHKNEVVLPCQDELHLIRFYILDDLSLSDNRSR